MKHDNGDDNRDHNPSIYLYTVDMRRYVRDLRSHSVVFPPRLSWIISVYVIRLGRDRAMQLDGWTYTGV